METITIYYDPTNGNYQVFGPFNVIECVEIMNSVSGSILRKMKVEAMEAIGSNDPKVIKEYIEILKNSTNYKNN